MSKTKWEFSVEVANAPEIPGEGKPRRTPWCQDKLLGVEKSLYENFLDGVKASGNKNCFGYRPIVDGVAQPFVWESYDQVHERILNLASAFIKLGLEKGSKVGIFMINRAEWLITEQACNAHGIITVPLYDTLGPEAIEFIINETEMSLIVASNDKYKQIISTKDKYPSITKIILTEPLSEDDKEKAESNNVDIHSFKDMETLGSKNRVEPNIPSPTDLTSIMYTSGTTGLPKGVMLCSKNFISDAAAVDFFGKKHMAVQITKDDVHLSYLPLAHVFERMVTTYCLNQGASIGFFQGSPLKLLDDIANLRPTIFPSVPRLLNRIYDKVLTSVENKGGLTAMLFNMALASKKSSLQDGYLTHWLWDRLVFSKVKERLGGRVKCIVTGSAPISPEVLDFLRVAFCCEVHEAYGQTESCAGTTLTLFGDYESGHIGTPFPCNEIKLVDIPEMKYSSKDQPHPRGEICIRGNNIFMGYYKNEEKTKEALDDDGWLHSGDIGLWDSKGRLRIIDRKKNIFKLAQGEYIAPEKIENVYAKSKYVEQVFVYGDSLKAFLVAVVIPDKENVEPWAHANGVSGSFEEIIKNDHVKDLILKDMIKTGKDLGLKSFEQIKDVSLDHVLFSVENDLLTPTHKLKRQQAKEYYQKQIDSMNEIVQKSEGAKEKKQHLDEENKK